MISFHEYLAGQRAVDPLGTPAEMLARAGISPDVPHEVVLKRMLKRWKRQALVPAGGQADGDDFTGGLEPRRPPGQVPGPASTSTATGGHGEMK